MSEEAVRVLLQTGGPLGGLLVISGFYILRLQKLLHEAQDARTRDAQAVTTTILNLVDKQHEQLGAVVKALDLNTTALRELRQLLSDELRRRTG